MAEQADLHSRSVFDLDRLASAAFVRIGDLISPWSTIHVPKLIEGVDSTPGTTGATGDLGTLGLYPGSVAYGGLLADTDLVPGWWVHNWTTAVVFPQAPYDAWLFYRFTVETVCNLYRAPVSAGSVMQFATLGQTTDAATVSLAGWQTVAWPVNVTLPRPDPLFFGGSAPVSGSIAVSRGRSAALGFILGAIASVADGYIQFLPTTIGVRRTTPAASGFGAADLATVEFRFEPKWWVEAIQHRISTA
jgi:hypothetical protein